MGDGRIEPVAGLRRGVFVEPEDEEHFKRVEQDLLAEFAAWAERNGRGEALERNGEFVGDAMLSWKWGYRDGRLGEWTVGDVDEFFLDYAPRKVPSDEDVVADAPECAAGLFSVLDAAGLLAGDPCRELVARCGAIAGEYEAAARDRSRWGPAKALVAQMESEGVDTSDQGALDTWIGDFNSRERADRDAIFGSVDAQLARALTGTADAPLPWELGGALEREPGGGAVAFAVGWFPADDYRPALELWTSIGELWKGIDHPEYCRRMEVTFRGWAAHGHRPRLVPIVLDRYLSWCEGRGDDPAEARPGYAAEMLRLGLADPWPPGRNDPCWCGSERKYKKCCGAASGSALHPLDATV
jgi:hypothetical protein